MRQKARLLLDLCACAALLAVPLLAQSTVTTNPRVTGESGTVATFGTGGAVASTNGTLATSVVTASNTSVGAEDNLVTYTLPGNTVLATGQGVRITAAGTFAANANAKSARLYFGGTVVATTTAVTGTPNNLPWRLSADVLRTSTTAQVAGGVIGVAAIAAWYVLLTAPTETMSSPIVIKVTGLSATAAADVTQRLLIVESIR